MPFFRKKEKKAPMVKEHSFVEKPKLGELGHGWYIESHVSHQKGKEAVGQQGFTSVFVEEKGGVHNNIRNFNNEKSKFADELTKIRNAHDEELGGSYRKKEVGELNVTTHTAEDGTQVSVASFLRQKRADEPDKRNSAEYYFNINPSAHVLKKLKGKEPLEIMKSFMEKTAGENPIVKIT